MRQFQVTLKRVEEITVTMQANSASDIRRLVKSDDGQDRLSEIAMSGDASYVRYSVEKIKDAE